MTETQTNHPALDDVLELVGQFQSTHAKRITEALGFTFEDKGPSTLTVRRRIKRALEWGLIQEAGTLSRGDSESGRPYKLWSLTRRGALRLALKRAREACAESAPQTVFLNSPQDDQALSAWAVTATQDETGDKETAGFFCVVRDPLGTYECDENRFKEVLAATDPKNYGGEK